MFALLAVVSFVAASTHISYGPERCEHESDFESARADSLVCLHKYADVNRDGKICAAEIDAVRSVVLWPWEKLIGLAHPTSEMMERCDYDGDGFISASDFQKTIGNCIATCAAIRNLFGYVCSRAAEMHLQIDPLDAVCSGHSKH